MKASLLLFALAPTASSESAPAPDFTWSAPAQVCPDLQQARARIAQMGSRKHGLVQAQAEVSESREGFELRLVMSAGSARTERVLRADDCETLFDAALFSFSLALEQQADVEAAQAEPLVPEPEPPVESRPPTDAIEGPPEAGSDAGEAELEQEPESAGFEDFDLRSDSAPAGPVEPSDRRRRKGAVGLGLRAHGGVASGPIGGPSAPLGGSFVLGGEHWRVELGALAYTPRDVESPVDPAAGARLSAWSLRTRGCGVINLSKRWLVPMCGQLEGGATRAAGFGVDGAQRPVAGHFLAGAVVGLGWVVHPRVSLLADFGGSVALARPAFVIDGAAGDLFVSPPASFGGEVGVEFRFGRK